MQRELAPAHRELCPGNQAQVRFASLGLSFGQPGELVVVGEGNHVDSPLGRPPDEGRGRQQAVGVGRMAVEVVAEHGRGSLLR